MTWDYLAVGAGFSDGVLAERLASQRVTPLFVLDCGSHIGGTAEDKLTAARASGTLWNTASRRVRTACSPKGIKCPFK